MNTTSTPRSIPAGAGDLSRAKQVLKHTNLVLCDIKFPTEAQYKAHCGGSLQHTVDFMRLTESMHIPLWVRHVVAPGLSDTVESLRAVKALAESFSNLEKIEWLPFKNICAAKYKALHIPFPMGDKPSFSQSHVEALLSKL